MKIVLLNLYDLGHPPFGLASPAAWLTALGHSVVCADAAVAALPVADLAAADVVAVHLPMHTAARLAKQAVERVRRLNPDCRLVAYGLYAPINADYLRELGFAAVVGGEYEQALCDAIAPGAETPFRILSLNRLPFVAPDRAALPPLERYAKLRLPGEAGGAGRLAGYTEASRGCKHLCRHCPVVPVYNGTFRVVPVDVVMADVRQQVAAGAAHISFGDPDFFNGPTHALRVVEALHAEFPSLTYDVTIKVEHLLRERKRLGRLRETGCVLVTSAVESVDPYILSLLDKKHSREDFEAAVALCRAEGLALAPTFVAFTPWTSREGYQELLREIRRLDLVEAVAPVQLALRLLLPPGSRLLELEETRKHVTEFDAAALLYRWRHPDPAMDELAARVLQLVAARQKRGAGRRQIFSEVWEAAFGAPLAVENPDRLARAAVPYLDEPWYC